MAFFCIPLSSCYSMVDIFLKSQAALQKSAHDELVRLNGNPNFTDNGSGSQRGGGFFQGSNSGNDCYNSSDSLGCRNSELFPLINDDHGDVSSVTPSSSSPSSTSSVYFFDDGEAYWLQVLGICFLHNILVIVGLIGNIFNIIILSKRGIGARTTNILLLSLAVNDCVLLLSNGIQNMTCFTCYLDPARAVYIDTVTNIYLTSPSRWISFVNLDITALITIERAIAVFFPFKANRLFNRNSIAVVYACIFLLLVVVLTPHMIMVRPLWQFDPDLNQTVANTFYFTGDFNGFLVLWSVVENVNAFVCVVIIFVCGSVTAIKLVKLPKSRTFLTTSRRTPAAIRQERRAVVMVLVICFISFLVHLPNSSNQLYSSLFLQQLAADGMYCALRALGSFLGTVNAAVNFFIFFFMSPKFKDAYKTLLACRRRMND